MTKYVIMKIKLPSFDLKTYISQHPLQASALANETQVQVSGLLVPGVPPSSPTSGRHLEKEARMGNKEDLGTWPSCHSSPDCPPLGFIFFLAK